MCLNTKQEEWHWEREWVRDLVQMVEMEMGQKVRVLLLMLLPDCAN